MNKLRTLLARHRRTLRASFAQGPIETTLGVVLALVFSLAVAGDVGEGWKLWGRVFASSLLLLPALLGVSTCAHTGELSAPRRWGLSAGLVALALVHGALGFDPDKSADLWRTGLLVVSAWSALLLAPLASRRPSDSLEAWFWTANHRILARFTTVLAFTGALYVGLALALASVETLFGLNLRTDPYLHLFGLTFFALVPALVVGSLSELSAPVGAAPAKAPQMVRWVGGYLVSPLLVVYVAILYAYNLKSVFSPALPENTLSPLALGAAAVAWVGILLTEPLKREEDVPVTVPLLRYFPAYFLPLLALPFWAIWLRVSEYGWTPFRVVRFAVLIGILVHCLVGVARLVQGRELSSRVIPMIAVAVFGLSAVGPWSATAVTKRSQTAALQSLLTELDRWRAGGGLDTSPLAELSGEDAADHDIWSLRNQVSEQARYLSEHFGEAYVLRALGLPAHASLTQVFEDMGLTLYWGWQPEDPDTYRDINVWPREGVWVEGLPAGAHLDVSWHESGAPGLLTHVGPYEVHTRAHPLRVVIKEVAADAACVFEFGAFASYLETEPMPDEGSDTWTPDLTRARAVGQSAEGASCGTLVLLGLQGGIRSDEAPPVLEVRGWSGRWVR